MRSDATKLSTMKGSQAWTQRGNASSSLPTQFLRQFCDDFVELRRGRVCFGTHRFISGLATIGRHSVLVLIHSRNGRRGRSRIVESARASINGYRKTEQLMQLAHKLNRPVVVCYAGSTSKSGAVFAEPHEARGFPGHVLSQWDIRVPIILVVLNSKAAYDIFGAWLADKILALGRTRFVLPLSDREQTRRVLVGAAELLRQGLIDKLIPAPSSRAHHSQVVTSYRLRGALVSILEELSRVSPGELALRRGAKFAQAEVIAANLCRRRTQV